ncbi:MAG: hypothetical protein RI564_03690 [Gracilimonas sp.]|nr:hypothetical protein [Gracilimonas sp.]
MSASYTLIQKIITLVFFGCFLNFNICSAQDKPQKSPASSQFDKGWFTLAIGNDYSSDNEINQRLALAFTANWGRTHFWQAGLNLNSTILFGGDMLTLHAARGFSGMSRFFRISIAAGPAFISIHEDRTNENDLQLITAGLIGDAQLLFTPVKEIGVGIQFHGNLNFRNQIAGPRLVLVIEGHK